jgi:hypothetical protein
MSKCSAQFDAKRIRPCALPVVPRRQNEKRGSLIVYVTLALRYVVSAKQDKHLTSLGGVTKVEP